MRFPNWSKPICDADGVGAWSNGRREQARNLTGEHVKGGNKRDMLNAIRADINAFRDEKKVDRLVMIWCASTEIYIEPGPAHQTVETLEAAIDAIDAGGEAAVSVEAVAKAAGVSAPTIYNHFRNREALVAEAQAQRFDRQLGRDFDEISRLVATIETRQQLTEMSGALIDFMLDPRRSAMRMDRMSAIGSAISSISGPDAPPKIIA